MAKVLVNAFDIPAGDGVTDFDDLGKTLGSYVDALADAGIVSGYDKDTFGYSDPIKRGDFAKMLYGAINYKPVGNPGENPSDVGPASVSLTTNSQQAVVGKQVTVTAKVEVAEGKSKAGIPVTFTIDNDMDMMFVQLVTRILLQMHIQMLMVLLAISYTKVTQVKMK